MKLVCFDTATDVLACALWHDGECVEHHELAPRGHADRVLSAVDRVLAEAAITRSGLDAIGFGRGPGSFTGLRISAGVAQGLAFALDLPAVPVSTLAAIAQGALRENGSPRALVVLDARLGEVYAGAARADAGIMRPMRDERRCRPEELSEELDADGGWVGCGPGWAVCADALRDGLDARLERLETDRLPRARDVAALAHRALEEGNTVSAEEALPVYLRSRVASRPRTGTRS
ncbi:MAG: tRNA (adenosine(37)-N6)-threonylcarbamoyltransferase complex dimerization subunit type 1 TsaB [Immundisolibacterales bacterium]|nr:tRNA (adenosine(37)-N6)-threonylcarbamoyltransferase complex dimerization subunit type 1 TsaB [Immundisolibacterales bacterium]